MYGVESHIYDIINISLQDIFCRIILIKKKKKYIYIYRTNKNMYLPLVLYPGLTRCPQMAEVAGNHEFARDVGSAK